MAGGGRQESSEGWSAMLQIAIQTSAEASLTYGLQAYALVASTMLGIWQICGGKVEYEKSSEFPDLEGRQSRATAELGQATNSGSSKRTAIKQVLKQWDVKENVTERIERSSEYNDHGIIDIIMHVYRTAFLPL